jgi:uncharacterized protein YacL
MNCILPCAIAFGFIGKMFYSLQGYGSKEINAFQKSLDQKQTQKYMEIVEYRTYLFLMGLLIGTIIGVLYLFYTRTSKNVVFNICVFIMIVFGSAIFYYIASKKPDYMLNHLTKEEQVKKWNDVYVDMQRRNIMGFLYGFIGYLLLSWAFYNMEDILL